MLLMFCARCRVHFETHHNTAAAKSETASGDTSGHQKRRLAIILCKFADKPRETRPRRFYEDYYTRLGTGGMADYWNDVTFGEVDLTDSAVLGWFTMTHTSREVAALVFPGGRNTLVQWGKDAAAANGVDLSKFSGVLVVQNWGPDHGAAGNGMIIVDKNENLIESTFIAHEMGHLFGLPHSYGEGVSPCISDSGVYCDAWDIMSAMNVFLYEGSFEGVSGTFGPGLNVFALKSLGALPRERRVTVEHPDFSDTIELSALNQARQAGEHYAIEITPAASVPKRADGSIYTVEYRHKGSWDSGLPGDAVLVHQEKDGHSVLQHTVNNSSLIAGQRYATPSPPIFIEVASIDRVSKTATVRVWDLPENGLRQEDSSAYVYLIQDGAKRRISPAALARLDRGREIRRVPDGGLASLPYGAPLE